MNFGVGTPLDHAVALVNFLLSLERHPGSGSSAEGFRAEEGPKGGLCHVGGAAGWESFIVQGKTAVDGPVSWVLRRPMGSTDSAHIRLIDPCKGECFSARDTSGPLLEVHTVIGAANAWCNVSPQQQPWAVSWDFNDAKAWSPMITAKLAAAVRRQSNAGSGVTAAAAQPVGTAAGDPVDVNGELGLQPPVSFPGVDPEALEEVRTLRYVVAPCIFLSCFVCSLLVLGTPLHEPVASDGTSPE